MKTKSLLLMALIALTATACQNNKAKEAQVHEGAAVNEVSAGSAVSSSKTSVNNELLVYLKLDGNSSGNALRLLMDEVLWISGDDTETLIKYGFDPENVDNDYELYNEKEEWFPVVTCPETTFKIWQYSDEGFPENRDVDLAAFRQHLSRRDDCAILAKVTVSDGAVLTVKEQYIP